jgi:hypothetical protein
VASGIDDKKILSNQYPRAWYLAGGIKPVLYEEYLEAVENDEEREAWG